MKIQNILTDEDWIIPDVFENPFEEKKSLDVDLIISTIKSITNKTITKDDAEKRLLKNEIGKEVFERFLKVFEAGRQYEKRRTVKALRELEEML